VTVSPDRTVPDALTEPARLVRERLEQQLNREIERWASVDPELGDLLTTLKSTVLCGGKRLRAAFCYWAFVGCGGDPDDPGVIDAGSALEMLHTAALLHDDIIDASAQRHGRETVHLQYAGRHRAAAWRGDSTPFGAGVGILLGDLALVYSDRLLGRVPPAVREVFDEVRLEVNMGQYLDLLGAAQGLDGGDQARTRAQRIRTYKTAKYTVERPLHLGAALAAPGRFDQLVRPLSAFGVPLGEAFQLRDDLLGAFGDPEVTGKPVGDDLREGKPTLLAHLAYVRATGPEAQTFSSLFGAPELSPVEALELGRVMEATGARREVETEMARLAAMAEDALVTLPVRPEARQALRDLAAFATARDR
jgi:geranylgeranyl diphosphate synthase, type I